MAHDAVTTKARPSSGRRLTLFGLAVFLCCALAGMIAAYRVPQRASTTPIDSLEAKVRRGPDSYFHHFFDPEQRFGSIGQVDLTLDNFERETTHGLLFAAISSTPEDVAEFTIKTAGIWAPGGDDADNGMVVFVFPAIRRVRVEVGYGLEAELPDALVRQLVESHLVPPLRDGDYLKGVEAIVPPLLERMRAVPPATTRAQSGLARQIVVAARSLPPRLRAVRAAWLENLHGPRIAMSTLGGALAALIAVLLFDLARCWVHLARGVLSHGEPGHMVGATLDLTNSLLRLFQIAFILFAMAAGTSFFFSGTGSFGGAGVEIPF